MSPSPKQKKMVSKVHFRLGQVKAQPLETESLYYIKIVFRNCKLIHAWSYKCENFNDITANEKEKFVRLCFGHIGNLLLTIQ